MSAPDNAVVVDEATSSSTSAAIDAFLAPLVKGTRGNNKSAASHRSSSKTAAGNSSSRPSSREMHREDKVVASIFDVPLGLLTRSDREESSPGPSIGHGHAAASTTKQQQQPEATAAVEATSPGTTTTTVKGVVSKPRGLTCIRCGLSFAARPAQSAHFKTDLHMTNLRRQLSGKPPVSEDQLDSALKAISGSTTEEAQKTPEEEEDSSSSDTESDEVVDTTTVVSSGTNINLELEDVLEDGVFAPADGVVGLANPSAEEEQMGNARGRVKVNFSQQEGPRFTFTPALSKWAFSLSSAALGMERGDDPWARLDALAGEEAGGGNRLWAVVILRSGKFAAGVFEGQSVLCHKVFRR